LFTISQVQCWKKLFGFDNTKREPYIFNGLGFVGCSCVSVLELDLSIGISAWSWFAGTWSTGIAQMSRVTLLVTRERNANGFYWNTKMEMDFHETFINRNGLGFDSVRRRRIRNDRSIRFCLASAAWWRVSEKLRNESQRVKVKTNNTP
jgi:hypothetical protein